MISAKSAWLNSILVLFALVSFGHSQSVIEAVRGKIQVDGKVDEFWENVPATNVSKIVKDLTNIERKDCPTALIRCAWDDSHLFVLADVKDSVISTKNGNPWAQDSIEIFVDQDFSRDRSLASEDLHFRISALGDVTFGGNANRDHVISKVVPMTGGYRVEAAIRLIPNILKENQKMGFEFQVNNDPGTGQRESITKWNHPKNDSWQSTANYGTIILGEKAGRKNSLHKKDNKIATNVKLNKNWENSNQFVPDWSRDAVFYQIFPERFRNGDSQNDPTRASLEFPDVVPDSWAVSNWTEQWYQRADWEKQMGGDFYDNGVFHRRYGGDLQGVIDKLDYLKELGINAIYFNPVFYARSLHKYDGNSFHHVDPHFGPDPKGDFAIMESETADPSTWKWTAADRLFLRLLKEAKRRKIRVIIDGVFNHTGRDFFAFKDLVKNQEASMYKHWYMVEKFDDPNTTENEFKYKGWWGVATLPEFANNPSDDDLHPDPKKYVMTATARWMDPNGDGDPEDGISGWRLDVANEVPNKFWRDWNTMVRQINPEAYTVAEIWDNAADYLDDCGFSATMNYHGFAFPSKGFLVDGRMPASDFSRMIQDRMKEHSPAVRFALQNMLDSHDTDRVLSMIVNARHKREYLNKSRFDYDVGERASPRYAKQYDVEPPSDEDKQILRLVAMFQMSFVGAPMIYYGTECGMDGADDPDDRMPMVWGDLEYGPRTKGPRGRLKTPIDVKFDRELFDFYKKLISVRTRYAALRRGDFTVLHTDDQSGLLVFERSLDDDKIVVVINRGQNDLTLNLKSFAKNSGRMTRLLTSKSLEDVSTRKPTSSHLDAKNATIAGISGQIWRVEK